MQIAKTTISRKKRRNNEYFYVIQHIFQEQFVSLQRCKIKEKDVEPAFRNAEGTKLDDYEKECK